MALVRLVIFGLIAGSGYALIGMGIALIFRVSRVLNFAHAAMGFALALAYIGLTTQLPSWPQWTILLLTLTLAFGVGVLLYIQTIRLLEPASVLAKVLATSAIASGILTTITWIRGSQLDFQIEPVVSGHAFSVSGVSISAHQLTVVVLSAAAAVALTLVLRRTLFGVALRAISQNRDIAAVSGVDTHKVAAITWGLSIALAGVGAVLVLAQTYVAFDIVPILLLKGLAAALVGGLVSPGAAWLGGLTIGVTENVLHEGPEAVQGLSGEIAFWLIVVLLLVGTHRRFLSDMEARAMEI